MKYLIFRLGVNETLLLTLFERNQIFIQPHYQNFFVRDNRFDLKQFLKIEEFHLSKILSFCIFFLTNFNQ